MRIGIDCRSILHPEAGESAGIGHYVHHLVAALLKEDRANEYVLFFDNHDVAQAKHELVRHNPRVTVRVLPFRSLRNLPFIYSHMIVASVFEREKLDLLHGPANTVPLFYRRPWVVTVHDLAIYDHPEWFPAGSLGTQRFSTSVLVPHSLEHARRIIAVSQTTAADVRRLFERAAPVDVVAEGVEVPPARTDADALLETRGVQRGNYFLFVGTIEPRKNLVTLVRAFAKAAIEGRLPIDAQLILAGGRGWRNADVFAEIREANDRLADERVRAVGYVSAAEKFALMAGARAFVFPSHYEGFGLPVLEAMALGTPVIASNTPALVETCGAAALLVPPTDASALASAMAELWHDAARREQFRHAGIERAAAFTWKHAAHATLQTYGLAAKDAIRTEGH